jgi:hypothetical protein
MQSFTIYIIMTDIISERKDYIGSAKLSLLRRNPIPVFHIRRAYSSFPLAQLTITSINNNETMGAPPLAPVPSVGYYGRGTSSRRNLNIHKSPSWWSRSRRVLFQRKSSRSFEEVETRPNLMSSVSYCVSRREKSKDTSCRSLEERDTIPNPEPEIKDAPASQNPMPSSLNLKNTAATQSCRGFFQSKRCPSLAHTLTTSRPTSVLQMSRCSLRCIMDKAVKLVNVKTVKPMQSTRLGSGSPTHATHKRRVHFSVDINDDDDSNSVQVETIRYKLESAECKSSLAWKTEEIKEIQQTCRDVVDFHKTNKDYVACIQHLFACKKSAPTTGGNDNKSDDDDDNVPQNSTVRQDAAAIRMLSKSLARGLEARVVPILCAHRQWGVKAILATQAKLNKCKVTDCEKREKLLRARSLQASKRSRVFALKLAQGDASEALMAGLR